MAILTYDLLWQIFEAIRDNCAPEYELACIAELGFESLETLLRQYFVSEIETVVGTDFGDEALTVAMLVERFEILPTVTTLEETYSVILAGPGGQTLGQWLSNPAADLSLIETISEAVEATAQTLYAQITGWNDPNTGYLRGGITVSAYLDSLRNAGSASAAFQLVAGNNTPVTVILAQSAHAADPLKLFGYLNGWPYAKFARRLIQIDSDI